MKNYYQILEVSETATQDEIKKQYRFLSQAWHPDKFSMPDQKIKAEEKIKELNEAYSVLGNSTKKREYDNRRGYQQEQPNEMGSQSSDTDFKGQKEKHSYQEGENSQKRNDPVRKKGNFPTLWALFGVVGVSMCVCIFLFSLNNLTTAESPPPTGTAMPASAKLATPTIDKIALPTPTPKNLSEFSNTGNMVLVPAGEFTMGRINGASNEMPAHVVRLMDFYIDKYEVTNSVYRECVNTGTCEPPTRDDSPSHSFYFQNPEFDYYPVIYVTWDMADTFCKWRGARLPTEAEWEKAARGNDNRIYPWGDEFSYGFSNFCDINCPHEWANKEYNDGYADTAPVGSFPQGQSPYGVFDMSGNVYEWVADWASENYYSVSPQENPIGPDFGQDRVIRGGAWGDSSATSITSRAGFSPISAYEFLGFRCAISADK